MYFEFPKEVQQQLKKDECQITAYLGSVVASDSVFKPLEGLPEDTWFLLAADLKNDDQRVLLACAKITSGGSWERTGRPSWTYDSGALLRPFVICNGCRGSVFKISLGDNKDVGDSITCSSYLTQQRSNLKQGPVELRKIRFYCVGQLPSPPPSPLALASRLGPVLLDAEATRLAEVAKSVKQFERTPFVLKKHQAYYQKGILELKDDIELVVETKAALQQLVANTKAFEAVRSRSSLVTLHLSFHEPFEPAEVTILLQSLGPHMMHLKAVCSTAAHCAAIVKVMESCPKEHLRVVSLLETESLDRAAIEELLHLSKTELEVLHFSEMPPGGMRLASQLCRQCGHLRIQNSPDDAVPEILSPKSLWQVTEAIPISQLKGQWAFITADPTSHPPWVSICVPVDEARAKQHSQLLARVGVEKEHKEADDSDPRVFNVGGEAPLNVRIVQLLVAYIENAEIHPLEDYPELTFGISLVDEYFLILLEERWGHLEHTINTTALELLRAGDYLQMPALRRLMRSFLVRRDARRVKKTQVNE